LLVLLLVLTQKLTKPLETKDDARLRFRTADTYHPVNTDQSFNLQGAMTTRFDPATPFGK